MTQKFSDCQERTGTLNKNQEKNQSEKGLLIGCVALKTGDHVLNVGSIVLGQETVARLGIFHLQARTHEKKVGKELRF
jgi:hypothetical protein